MSSHTTAESGDLIADVVGDTEEEAAREAESERRLLHVRARHALNDAPELAAHIRSRTLYTNGLPERGFLPSSRTPLSSLRADDADELYTSLIDWVSYWSRWLDFQPTTSRPRAWSRVDITSLARDPQQELLGFRGGENVSTVGMLISLQTHWLLRRDPQIVRHPAADVYQRAIIDLVWRLRAQYGLTPAQERNVSPRPCSGCGHFAVSAEWTGLGITDVEIKCEHCGRRVDAPRASKIEGWIRASDPVLVMSDACDLFEHDLCESVHCECWCHDA